MVCMGLEPGAAVWKAQTNPLSCGGTPDWLKLVTRIATPNRIALIQSRAITVH